MNTMDCKTCRSLLPDLLFEPGFVAGPEAAAHLDACPACRTELDDLRATMALIDDWVAQDPSP